MNIEHLNLARKWRSKNFDQVIGQDLSVRILKNSLYLNQYFPVYLFAGQRGCGKTTMARVFAAAINCEQLDDFQKNPKSHTVPCLICPSCQAILAGRHPDFIEIDAASNTGVDNVRQIIDASALLPIMGRKKIYLIDEAHMLSKAAFNALLKLLEEPPISVLFILATTDTHKIIDTVRSRCFQLFFKPVEESILVRHLRSVCDTENIMCDDDALALIVKETEGSVRDAINLLERVRFASNHVTRSMVQQLLGHIDDERILACFELMIHKGPASLLHFLHEQKLDTFSAEYIWNRLVEVTRAALWVKHGISPRTFSEYTAQLQFLVKGCSFKKLIHTLELFYANEPLFGKTTAQYPFLEMILLQLCQKNESNSNSGTPSLASAATASDDLSLPVDGECEDEDNEDEDEEISDEEEASPLYMFVHQLEVIKDHLLITIFKQARVAILDMQKGLITIALPKELFFFNDIIENNRSLWHPLLCNAFSKQLIVQFIFEERAVASETPVKKELPVIEPVQQRTPIQVQPVSKNDAQKFWAKKNNFKQSYVKKEATVMVSDTAHWPFANLLLTHFPGTITEINETV